MIWPSHHLNTRIKFSRPTLIDSSISMVHELEDLVRILTNKCVHYIVDAWQWRVEEFPWDANIFELKISLKICIS